MATRTRHATMSAIERKLRLLMIKERRTPVRDVVTSSAIQTTRPITKLAGMDIVVAVRAGGRRYAERNAPWHLRRGLLRPVTLQAVHCLVRAAQRKLCRCVIERGNGFPRLRVMTRLTLRLAGKWLVRIGVAGRTSRIRERVTVGRLLRQRLVTVNARRRDVCAQQWKSTVAMPRLRIGRRKKSTDGMTGFACVLKPRLKLACVIVLVAVDALSERRMIVCVLSPPFMTLHTGNSGMLACQRVLSSSVF